MSSATCSSGATTRGQRTLLSDSADEDTAANAIATAS